MKVTMKNYLRTGMIALLGAWFIMNSACKKDEPVYPAPSVSVGAAASGLAGASATISANLASEKGLKSLSLIHISEPTRPY